MNFIYISCISFLFPFHTCLDAFVECFRKLEIFCQFVTKRGSLLGEMILFPKLPKGEFVNLKFWLMFVSKMERKEPS
jgi:hypothetical protein